MILDLNSSQKWLLFNLKTRERFYDSRFSGGIINILKKGWLAFLAFKLNIRNVLWKKKKNSIQHL